MTELQSLARPLAESAGSVVVPMPRPRWFSRLLLPLGIVASALGLLAYSARDNIWPPPEVRVVRAAVRDGAVDASTEADSTGDASAAEGASIQPRQIPAANIAANFAAVSVALQAPGWIEPDPYPVYVSALTDGVIKEVLVLEGATVKAGQVVARMIREDAELSLRSAEARLLQRRAELTAAQADWDHPVELKRMVATAEAMTAEATAARLQLESTIELQQAKLNELKIEYERIKSLLPDATTELEVEQTRYQFEGQQAMVAATLKQGPVLDARVESAKADLAAAKRDFELRTADQRRLDEAKAAVESAQTAVAEAKLRLSRMDIVSPVDGVVMQRYAVPGGKVMFGMDSPHSAHVLHLYEPTKLQVRVDVPLADAAKVGIGQRTLVIADVLPDREFKGEVTRLVHQADIGKNTVQVKVAIHDPSPLLKPDVLTRVKFLGAAERGGGSSSPGTGNGDARLSDAIASTVAVFIPESVVRTEGDDHAVWLVRPDQRIERRVINKLGSVRPDGWVRVDGLRPGDAVVADSSAKLTAGQKVRAVESEN